MDITKIFRIIALLILILSGSFSPAQDIKAPDRIITDGGTSMEVLSVSGSRFLNFSESTLSITTIFASNNNFNGNMFDIEVIGVKGIMIDSFDINLTGTADIYIYYKDGSYVGSETTASDWTLAGMVPSVVGLGQDIPTPVNIGGIWLNTARTYGLYVTTEPTGFNHPTISLFYTNGNNEYTDANLKLTTGIGLGGYTLFEYTYPDRTWNGTIYYHELPTFPMPLGNWAIYLGIALIVVFLVFRYTRRKRTRS